VLEPREHARAESAGRWTGGQAVDGHDAAHCFTSRLPSGERTQKARDHP
jgi:hypothetical protein